jgi:hypothetical protein
VVVVAVDERQLVMPRGITFLTDQLHQRRSPEMMV